MEVVTVKIGDEVRTESERGGTHPRIAPTAVIAWAGDGEVTLVLRGNETDTAATMHRVAAVERNRRERERVLDARLRRRSKISQRRIENRKVG